MLDGIIICERLRLFKTTGVNGGEPEFAGFMGGVDKLARDPVSPNYSETYHKRQRTPERDFRQCSTPFRPCQCAATHSGILLARRAPVCAISPNSDASAQIFRLTVQNLGIQHRANPRQLFPKSCVGSVPFIQIRRVNADSVNAILLRQPDRPLIMECLRDNRNAAFAKHFPGANYGVQRGESGIITKNGRFRHTFRYQRLLHRRRFIVLFLPLSPLTNSHFTLPA